ncbi:Major Facilitator Superfamily protein [Butyrivibrio fibrisolvens]|uniref:Major Facilitator Superfamily protein n=1 Tax=Butyrivibrio fibrisolvens TaxID=831 RepID=A0A1H9P4F1_BUTFI|nr:MFS transporter [Butyrivibrio fibrisolvens]SER42937.1 Major Facilitator Superfamily protein [Butyrivibrio fibrisolvens]
MGKNNAKSGIGFWLLIWLLGLAGQLCWNMENQWFNTFVYAKIAKDPTIISWMLAISAAATTVSTFLFGCVSDRKGNRKTLVSVGYILWGIFTIIFGTTEFMNKGSDSTLIGIAFAVVAADAIMSFFGSMGNDIGFNAWINDHMTPDNSGALGAALAVQPVIGTIVGTIAGGLLVGADDNYMRLFTVIGGSVILLGIVSLFGMKDVDTLKPSIKGSFSEQFFSIFNIKAYLQHRELVFVNLMLAVYFISFNVYFSHLGNFMIYYLGFTADTMGLIEGVGLIVAMFVTIPAIKLIKADRSSLLIFVAIILNSIGLLAIGLFVSPTNVDPSTIWNPNLMAGMLFVGVGYILFLQTITVWSKRLYPEDSRGQFEGIRIVFYVLIPMVIAPLISNPVIKNSGEFVDEYGFTEYLPTNAVFIAGLIVLLVTLIPLYFADREHKK